METTKKIDFTDVYNDYKAELLGFVTSKVNYKTEVAEEIVQDIFVKISKNLHLFDKEISNLETWIFTISNNTITDYYRSKLGNYGSLNYHISDLKRENGSAFEIANERDVINIEQKEINLKIHKSIENLNNTYKQVVLLALIEKKKMAEISELMDLPINTVKVTLLRAKKQLQITLKDTYKEMYQ